MTVHPGERQPDAGPTESPAGWAVGWPQLVSSLSPGTVGSAGRGFQPDALLRQVNQAGELFAADVHVATSLGRLAGEGDEQVLLWAARVVAAVRNGSSCLEVVDPSACSELAGSPMVAVGDADVSAAGAGRPLRLVGNLLYLDRFWRDERKVAHQILARAARHPVVDLDALRDSLEHNRFGSAPDRQRVATALAVLNGFTVVVGGPGTGKTTTVARIIAALTEQPGPTPRIALAAPTGKAAARLQAAIAAQTQQLDLPDHDLRGGTIHRLLGYRPGSPPRHRLENPLPHDVVIIDETSMVSLPLLARILAAVRPDARLILLGDPDQLASVDVGAVLADLVDRPVDPAVPEDPRAASVLTADLAADPRLAQDARRGVVRLDRGFRNNPEIAALANAIQSGDGAEALRVLADPTMPSVRLLTIDAESDLSRDPDLAQVRDRVLDQERAATAAAAGGDARLALDLLGGHQILTAHRSGPFGAARWSAAVSRAVARAQDQQPDPGARGGPGSRLGGDPSWYVGRPVIITRNDDDTGLSNGDVGIGVRRPGAPGEPDRLVVAFDVGEPLELSPGRLPEHLPLQAITVHRSQGSQYDAVTVVLPEAGSALLTRELLYTAVTRAREGVAVLGSPEAVVAAVTRRAHRASGLRSESAWHP